MVPVGMVRGDWVLVCCESEVIRNQRERRQDGEEGGGERRGEGRERQTHGTHACLFSPGFLMDPLIVSFSPLIPN